MDKKFYLVKYMRAREATTHFPPSDENFKIVKSFDSAEYVPDLGERAGTFYVLEIRKRITRTAHTVIDQEELDL